MLGVRSLSLDVSSTQFPEVAFSDVQITKNDVSLHVITTRLCSRLVFLADGVNFAQQPIISKYKKFCMKYSKRFSLFCAASASWHQ